MLTIIYERSEEDIEEHMAARNHDLHGNAPDTRAVALLLIDVINDLEFLEDARSLRRSRRGAHRKR